MNMSLDPPVHEALASSVPETLVPHEASGTSSPSPAAAGPPHRGASPWRCEPDDLAMPDRPADSCAPRADHAPRSDRHASGTARWGGRRLLSAVRPAHLDGVHSCPGRVTAQAFGLSQTDGAEVCDCHRVEEGRGRRTEIESCPGPVVSSDSEPRSERPLPTSAPANESRTPAVRMGVRNRQGHPVRSR